MHPRLFAHWRHRSRCHHPQREVAALACLLCLSCIGLPCSQAVRQHEIDINLFEAAIVGLRSVSDDEDQRITLRPALARGKSKHPHQHADAPRSGVPAEAERSPVPDPLAAVRPHEIAGASLLHASSDRPWGKSISRLLEKVETKVRDRERDEPKVSRSRERPARGTEAGYEEDDDASEFSQMGKPSLLISPKVFLPAGQKAPPGKKAPAKKKQAEKPKKRKSLARPKPSCTNITGTRPGFREPKGGAARPPMPMNVTCTVSGHYARVYGATVPDLVDRVYFYVSARERLDKPFVELTVKVRGQGAEGSAEGLVRLRKTGSFTVFARAHQRDRPENGGPRVEGGALQWWSKFSNEAHCHAVNETITPPKEAHPKATVKTHWIEVFRHLKPGNALEGLDDNNAAGMGGYAIPLGSTDGPTARYCVELAEKTFDGIITDNVAGKPHSSKFANYLSCNRGECECMVQADRTIGRQPLDAIRKVCHYCPWGAANNMCRCESEDEERSNMYTGRARLVSPFRLHKSWFMAPPHALVGYPGTSQELLTYWYSFPLKGRCKPDEAVGTNNCTWQRHSVTAIAYNEDIPSYIKDIGTIQNDNGIGTLVFVDDNTTKNNVHVASQYWGAMKLPKCGSGF